MISPITGLSKQIPEHKVRANSHKTSKHGVLLLDVTKIQFVGASSKGKRAPGSAGPIVDGISRVKCCEPMCKYLRDGIYAYRTLGCCKRLVVAKQDSGLHGHDNRGARDVWRRKRRMKHINQFVDC